MSSRHNTALRGTPHPASSGTRTRQKEKRAGPHLSARSTDSLRLVPSPHLATERGRATATSAVDVLRALTDLEIRVSCHSNDIDFHAAVCQQAELIELTYKIRQLYSLASNYPFEDEMSLLRMEHGLLRDQNELLGSLIRGWALRATAVSDVMAHCGFSDTVPCLNILDALPISPSPRSPTLNIQEVALGQPIMEWIDYRTRSYHRDSGHQGKSVGELEKQLWEDLPSELQRWVLKPRPEPLGFLRNWYQALMSKCMPIELWKSLNTVRRNARADQGNLCCPTCKPNNHRVTHKPRGSLLKRTLEKLGIRRLSSANQREEAFHSV